MEDEGVHMLHFNRSRIVLGTLAGSVIVSCVLAQDNVPIRNWATPLYWQPSEHEASIIRHAHELEMASPAPLAGTSTPPLVFVGMTPCRVMDTRIGQGQTGAFGPPMLQGGGTRTVPIPTHPTCGVPANALAYSLNVTVVPNGALGYLTMWPTGQARPLVSTLNALTGNITANAAIVPAGTSGSVNLFASDTTEAILDINGYYTAPSALALGAGTPSAPSLTFSNDANTGLYSSAAGTVKVTSSGIDVLTVNSSGLTVGGSGAIFGNWAALTTSSAGYYAMRAISSGVGITTGVIGTVDSATGTGGSFTNNATTGKAISATVNGSEVMNATETGIHAGPAMTGTPFAYSSYNSAGTKLAGSSNITCTWDTSARPARYD